MMYFRETENIVLVNQQHDDVFQVACMFQATDKIQGANFEKKNEFKIL